MTEGFDAEYWESRYRGHAGHRSTEPSPQLVAEVAALTPGAALEAGCGEGADAAWLAQRGWRVTAVDVSPTALDRARRYAATRGRAVAERIQWVEADLLGGPPTTQVFDLVTSHYVHPAGPVEDLIRHLAGAVAAGGTLLAVGHAPDDTYSAAHGGQHAAWQPTELARMLRQDQWRVEVAETRTRAHGPHELRDAVLRARRH